MVRQDQVRLRRRLVRRRREAHDEGHARERRLERAAGQRVRGVRVVHQEHVDVAVRQRALQIEDFIAGRERVQRGTAAKCHGAPELPADRVEEQHRDFEIDRVRIAGCRAAAHRQRWPGGRELSRQRVDVRGLHVGDRRQRLGRVRRHERSDPVEVRTNALVRQPVRDDGVHEREREGRFRPGPDGNPPVRVEPGERQARAREHEASERIRRAAAPERRVLPCELHVRHPRLEEVGAERQHEVRLVEPIRRDFGPTHDHRRSAAERLVVERLAEQTPIALHEREPLAREPLERSGRQLPNPRNAARSARPRLAQLLCQCRLGVVPAHGLIRTVAFSKQRPPESVRIVKRLNGRLAAHAQGASVHRMLRIALDFDDPRVNGLGEHTAARRTLAACRGDERRFARDDVVGSHEIGNERF